ncbi:uncharacterized protein [Musca autumnalis]|uniref:uncharacterized protein n=1 Tax=Musca autumnalis TaxID=221902 RepID=UPI003CE73860
MIRIIIGISLVAVVRASRYEFVFYNQDIFENCPQILGNKALHDLMNMSEITFELFEGYLSVVGNATLVWEGVEPTDRVQGKGELYKFQRGTWQVTPLSMVISDFCKVQFDPKTMWYQHWGQHIPLDERKCINTRGHTYHFEPFNVDTIFDYPMNIEGRHKIIFELMAYDQWNKRRPKTICIQVVGEIIKVK